MRICWEVLKRDLEELAHAIGAAFLISLGFILGLFVLLLPSILVDRYLLPREVSVKGFVLFSILCWVVVLVVGVILRDALDRYTDIWSDCGEHGGEASDG